MVGEDIKDPYINVGLSRGRDTECYPTYPWSVALRLTTTVSLQWTVSPITVAPRPTILLR